MASSTILVDMEKLASLEWSLIEAMRTKREGGGTERDGAAAVSLGNQVVVLGGYHTRRKFLRTVASYNGQEWKALPDMTSPRMGCGACSISGSQIIVTGGFRRGRTYLKTAETLDLSQEELEWKELPSMSVPRAGCATVAIGNELVVVLGGWIDSDTAVDTVEQYNVATGEWSTLPTMLTARAGCTAVVVDNSKIIVMGGHSNYGYCLSSVEQFDLATQEWTALPSMTERRDASAACVVGQCVLVFGGGEYSKQPTNKCEVFDTRAPEKGWWSTLPPLTSARFGCTAAAIGAQVIVMGGRGPDGNHLETVETVTLPLLDVAATPQQQQVKSKPTKKKTTASPPPPPPSPPPSPPPPPMENEWKQMVDATLQMATHMMEKEKTRTNASYERTKMQASEECEQKLVDYEQRLKYLEVEKRRILRNMKGAQRLRDDQLLKAEEQRRESLAQIERHYRPLIARAANSSAPEHLLVRSQTSSSSSMSTVQASEEEVEPPDELKCCITGALMRDPVTAADGHTYEREAIEEWFRRKATSPKTNEKLSTRRLIPSHNIRSQCRHWAATYGDDLQEVQSCIEPRRRASMGAAAHHHYRHHTRSSASSSSRSLFGRSSSAPRGGRRSTEPPSPLGRSFTLFGGQSRRNASGLAVTRRPSH